jgi:hypothetical protein
MKYETDKKPVWPNGFTLAEVLAALTIGTMVLIVVLAIYSRAQNGAAGVTNKLESNRLPQEILQRISEDLDRIISSGQETQINIDNKFQEGYQVAKLEIIKSINNEKNEPQTLEKIVWQSNIEPDNPSAEGLTLYRSHSGIAMEDALLDRQKEQWQRELFVPVCTGLTLFSVVVPDGNNVINKWSGQNLPAAITMSLSLAQPSKAADGTLEVPEEDIIVHTVAIDRTRKLTFVVPPPPDINEIDMNEMDMNSPDANSARAEKQPVITTTGQKTQDIRQPTNPRLQRIERTK